MAFELSVRISINPDFHPLAYSHVLELSLLKIGVIHMLRGTNIIRVWPGCA
jgi:hypothetical protein